MDRDQEHVGLHAPPPGGYSIDLFTGYLSELEAHVASRGEDSKGRAVFEITYLVFSRQVLDALEAGRFEDTPWATHLACRFIEVYRDQCERWERRDRSLCRPWWMAFEAAELGRANVLQAMLLGINAHINYDLAFATYGACVHAGDLDRLDSEVSVAEHALGLSRTGVPMVRYRDYLVINQLEWEAIELIQDTVLQNYNQLLYWGNRLTKRAARFAGQRILMEARDTAWLQTTLLVHAGSEDDRRLIGRLIDAYAAGVGELVSSFTLRPDRMRGHWQRWNRHGDTVDDDLLKSLVDLSLANPVVGDLILQQLAATGVDPAEVLLMLVQADEPRLAGVFGKFALREGPRRSRQQLIRFLDGGSDEAATVLDALILAGVRRRELPRGSPVDAVRQRWTGPLSDNVACLELDEVASNPELWNAVADDTRQLRLMLDCLGDAGAPATGSTSQVHTNGVGSFLSRHHDPWVRECARVLEDPDAVSHPDSGGEMNSSIERVLFLKDTQVFSEVDTSVLIRIANRLETASFEAGEAIIRQGERPGGVHIITAGDVEVRQRRNGTDVVISRQSVHDALGELSVLNGTPASADCVAVSPVKSLFLPSSVLSELVHQHPRLAVGLIRTLSQRLMQANLKIQS